MPGEPTLKRGRHNPHEWVVYAQTMLNQALAGGMHIDIPENGTFDEAMEQEFIAFQSRHGIGNDGEIGPNTWAALHSAIAAKQRQAQGAQAEQDDQLSTPAREVHNPPGQRDDNTFHERTDMHGNTVRVYDVDPDSVTVTPGATTDWNTAVSLMIEHADKNTGEQIPYVLSAILEFQTSSHDQIAGFVASAQHFEQETHVEFPWGLLVDGLDHALGIVFTVEGVWAGWVYEKVKGAFTNALTAELEHHASQVAGLQAKLEAGVTALVDRANRETRQTVDEVKAGIKDYIKDQMQNYQQVTNDADWIAEMVTYFGFPASSEASVTQPILHSLNAQFGAMLRQAEDELVKNA
jgi:Putative peptidoglycan binding domain